MSIIDLGKIKKIEVVFRCVVPSGSKVLSSFMFGFTHCKAMMLRLFASGQEFCLGQNEGRSNLEV